MTKTVVRPASAKQVAFIVRLSDERVAPAKPHTEEVVSYFRCIAAARKGNTVSSRMASAAIEFLLTLPKKAAPLPEGEKQAAQPGYYFRDGKVYVVIASKNNPGRLYAKVLIVPTDRKAARARWEYAPGVHKHLLDSERLTAVQAASLGHQHGYCMVCGRRLDDPRSVQDGIGPVCIKNLGGLPSKAPRLAVGSQVTDTEGWVATVVSIGRKYALIDYGQGWDPAKVDASTLTPV